LPRDLTQEGFEMQQHMLAKEGLSFAREKVRSKLANQSSASILASFLCPQLCRSCRW
jgi:hypothetical protein